MLPIPPKYKLVLLLVIVGGIAVLKQLAMLNPTLGWIGGVVQVLGILEAYLTMPGAAKGAAVLLLALGVSFGCSSCTNGQPSPVVVPSVDLAVCIFDQYATAPACRPTGNWLMCVSGIAVACGADVASVEKVLTAERKAMVADGYVLPPAGDR